MVADPELSQMEEKLAAQQQDFQLRRWMLLQQQAEVEQAKALERTWLQPEVTEMATHDLTTETETVHVHSTTINLFDTETVQTLTSHSTYLDTEATQARTSHSHFLDTEVAQERTSRTAFHDMEVAQAHTSRFHLLDKETSQVCNFAGAHNIFSSSQHGRCSCTNLMHSHSWHGDCARAHILHYTQPTENWACVDASAAHLRQSCRTAALVHR